MPREPTAVCSPQKCTRPLGANIAGRNFVTVPGWKYAQAPPLNGSRVHECWPVTVSAPFAAGRIRSISSTT